MRNSTIATVRGIYRDLKLSFAFLSLTFLLASFVSAQCDGQRFLQFIVDEVDVESDIEYGANINVDDELQTLHLDVYQPAGDVETERPLIIMAHGGSFVAGSKTGNDVVPLCTDYARLGYVVASIEYRLGAVDPGEFFPTPASATRAVWRAVHDARAAIRFFRKSAEEDGNPYGIDPDRILIGGVSAGGFIALHVGYLNSLDEFPEGVDSNYPGITEDIEGESGNPGYSSDIAGIVNIAGAIGDTAWMDADEPPLISFHGDEDDVVPYDSDVLVFLGFIQLIEVDGSSSIHPKADELGITNCFETHEGFGHTPHVGNPAIYDTTLTMSKNFLYHLVCDAEPVCAYENSPLVTSIADSFVAKEDVLVFPNPATDRIQVDLNQPTDTQVQMRLYNTMGALVQDFGPVNANQFTIERQGWPAGVYLLEIWNENSRQTVRVVFR